MFAFLPRLFCLSFSAPSSLPLFPCCIFLANSILLLPLLYFSGFFSLLLFCFTFQVRFVLRLLSRTNVSDRSVLLCLPRPICLDSYLSFFYRFSRFLSFLLLLFYSAVFLAPSYLLTFKALLSVTMPPSLAKCSAHYRVSVDKSFSTRSCIVRVRFANDRCHAGETFEAMKVAELLL